jgi:hypothetical protein
MKNKSRIIIFIIVIVVIFSFYLVFAWGKGSWPFEAKYQVVTLTNGEVYYGRLRFFPSPRLIDTWLFQQTSSQEEQEGPELNLVPFNSLFFGPENILYLQKEQIAWWADLKEDSAILDFINSQKGTPTVVPSSDQVP